MYSSVKTLVGMLPTSYNFPGIVLFVVPFDWEIFHLTKIDASKEALLIWWLYDKKKNLQLTGPYDISNGINTELV